MCDVIHYPAAPGFAFVVFGVRGEGGDIVRGDSKGGDGGVQNEMWRKEGGSGRGSGVLLSEVVGDAGLS